MAWSSDSNKEYHSKAYKKARAYVVRRDRALCFRCEVQFSRYVPFDSVDHFIPLHRQTKVTHDVNQLWCLCRECHAEKTTNEANKKEYVFRPRVDPATGYDYDETNWLQLIEDRTTRYRSGERKD